MTEELRIMDEKEMEKANELVDLIWAEFHKDKLDASDFAGVLLSTAGAIMSQGGWKSGAIPFKIEGETICITWKIVKEKEK